MLGIDLAGLMYQIGNALIGLAVVVIVFLGFVFIVRSKNQKAVEGKILVHFFTASGGYYWALCKEDKGQVEAPEGHDVGMYNISNECTYLGKYPPSGMKYAQVAVPTTVYIENEAEPRVSTDPSRWIESPEKKEITAFMARTALNESFQKTALAMQTAVWGDIAKMTQFIKNVPMMFYVSLAVLGGMLITGYLAFQCYQMVAQLLYLQGY